MSKEIKFTLGSPAKDIITGFSGTLTGFCRYLTGCDQYLITPKVDKEGKINPPKWYDENRIELSDGRVIVLDETKDNGPDLMAPIK